MGLKRLIRDVVFVVIAVNLIRTWDYRLAFYGLIIAGFTLYFYLGK